MPVVDVQELGVVRVEVGAYLWMDATGAFATLTGIDVASVHAVHVGRWTAEIAEITFEVRHLDDLFHLFNNALLGAAGDKLTLMGRNGAESAASEASAVDIDTMFDHVVGWYALTFILKVGLPGVGQVERRVKLIGSHRGVGGIDYNGLVAHLLEQPLGMHHV